jgi:flagellar motility protein MotE (MotC chaperone)
MSFPIHQLRRSVSLQPNPSYLTILDTIKPEDFDEENIDTEEKIEKDDPSHFSEQRTKFVCRCCRKSLISKYALENHMVRCFASKIERMNELILSERKDHQEEIKKIETHHRKMMEELEERHDAYIHFLQKGMEATDKKWIELYETMFQKMSSIVMMSEN